MVHMAQRLDGRTSTVSVNHRHEMGIGNVWRHGFLGQRGECIHAAGVSAKCATDDGGCAEAESLDQPLLVIGIAPGASESEYMASGCCSPRIVTRFEFRRRDIPNRLAQREQAAGVEPTAPRARGKLRLGHCHLRHRYASRGIRRGATAADRDASRTEAPGIFARPTRPPMVGPSLDSRDVAGCRESRPSSVRAAPRRRAAVVPAPVPTAGARHGGGRRGINFAAESCARQHSCTGREHDGGVRTLTRLSKKSVPPDGQRLTAPTSSSLWHIAPLAARHNQAISRSTTRGVATRPTTTTRHPPRETKAPSFR